ncbi:MAG: HutD family protein [Betaproteobacteria bacterium]|nr:HutD family protein [Betaproteobacteria bacterium]
MNTIPAWQYIALANTQPSPWKNGGGTTRELLTWPDPQDWTLRLSVAQVEADGPFSRFEGITRWFAVLSGAGVRLHMGASGHTHSLTASSDPLEFDGAQALDCRLINGPTQDFNLMARSTRHPHSRMQRVAGHMYWHLETPTLLAVWANSAPALVEWSGHAGLAIAPGTLAWATLAQANLRTRLTVQGADALFMEIGL